MSFHTFIHSTHVLGAYSVPDLGLFEAYFSLWDLGCPPLPGGWLGRGRKRGQVRRINTLDNPPAVDAAGRWDAQDLTWGHHAI